MKILSIEFTDNWSWGLIFKNFYNKNNKIKRVFMNENKAIPKRGYDVLLSQNVTLLKKFKERLKTVCRMGGNYNFEGINNLEPLLLEMSKCHALIATNKKLYYIACAVNDNVHLLPNGLDLNVWKPIDKPRAREFTVGFCGNITSEFYRDYKGFDYVFPACRNICVNLKQALFGEGQIKHTDMMDKFYYDIDVLVHPTKGEGCSNTIMEALACGVPVITTACAGYHGEQMTDDVNVLICDRSTRSIQDKILKLKRDESFRKLIGDNGRTFAQEHHDIQVISKKYHKIFADCHKSNKKGGAK